MNDNIISIQDRKINVGTLKSNTRKLDSGLIAPAKEYVPSDIAPEHAAEPIKNIDDIFKITHYLVDNKRWRDNMLFIVGINFGLRVSDLRMLRFCNLINDNLTFKQTFPVFEKKTRNTRSRKINRYITINKAVIEAVTLYLEHKSNISLSDFMFVSESNNGKNSGKPLDPATIDRILKKIAKDLNINVKVSTHTLRKTFCYHQMAMSDNSDRKLLLLQKMLNHSTPAQTLDYIGITREEMQEAYENLNLGSEAYSYIRGSTIVEVDETRFA